MQELNKNTQQQKSSFWGKSFFYEGFENYVKHETQNFQKINLKHGKQILFKLGKKLWET
jgi:hypothetical protein